MTQVDFFAKITPKQQDEFNNDIKGICEKITKTGVLPGDKLGEVNTNIRLENQIYLNVTIFFKWENKNKLSGFVKEITELTLDQYLDSINESQHTNGIKLK